MKLLRKAHNGYKILVKSGGGTNLIILKPLGSHLMFFN